MVELSKKDKRVKILKLIRKHREISRAELSRLSNFTRPTISAIVSELKELGFIEETGKGESSGGKRPIMLKLQEQTSLVLGIDLADETCVRGVICNLSGEILHKQEVAYRNDFPNLLNSTCEVIDKLLNFCGKEIKGIGVAVSGIVDSTKNEVTHSSNFDIENKNIAKLIEAKYNTTILLANRPNAAAIGESLYGVGKKYKNLVYLTTGQGVGAGIINNGKIFSGHFGYAGEIGKMIIDPFIPEIPTYPNEHTLEYRIRSQYILDRMQKVTGSKLTYAELLNLFHAGDKIAEEMIFQNANYLAYGASIISNIINPRAIILGGRVKDFGDKYLNYFSKKFYNYLMLSEDNKLQQTELLISEFGNDGVAFGGAVLILNKIFNLNL